MRLIIENIGNVGQAEIEIKGITVIAGQNGTGKSTISRSLFSIFSANYDVFNKISKDRINSINDILSNYLSDIEVKLETGSKIGNIRRVAPRLVVRELLELISNNLSIIIDENYGELYSDIIKNSITDSIIEFNEDNVRYQISNIEDLDLDAISEGIEVILSQSDKSIFNQILTTQLNDEFYGQINNIYNPTTGLISLIIKDEQIKIKINNNRAFADKLVNFRTDVVYIDDAASIVDNTFSNRFWIKFTSKLDHNTHLIKQIEDDGYDTHTLRARVTDKLNLLFNNINATLKTDLVNSSEDEEDDKKLNIVNYSSGMKTFYLIKSLLEKGVIRENGTLILDEPEVHLHPEWQLKFAEIIVLLQKAFGLHILINSHSPYLVEAIDIFSKKNGINNSVKYYLSKDGIKDVTDSIDKIYEQMYVPLNRLEELAEDFDDE
ncbi:ATP-binding protein [Streptococcus mitis]|mgnify:FL=1|jgi:hypothetical protein|uniref:ATP-binding protein n=1 Tax=Streptococcus mitis TaxID=28037 RepID=UPI0020006B22|nr:AAA family ATPase [Streptococcus mitis]